MPNVEPLREGDPAAVGPYRLAGRLGAGGHGVVYLARGRDGGPVAVKVLAEGVTAGEPFVREVTAAHALEPSCVARVLDASARGRPYIVTEYVDGPSLQETGALRGADELRRLAVATATALAAAHRAGVAHRDFKPANVLLGSDGPRVTDFGVSAAFGTGVSATGNITGTPAYMAPEQLSGREAGAPADVFAWASVIVFAATGTPPFGDDSLPAVINRILHDEPRTGDLPQPLLGVVLACLAKDPDRRPAMGDVLRHLLGGPPDTSPSPPRPAPSGTPDTSPSPSRPAPSGPQDAFPPPSRPAPSGTPDAASGTTGLRLVAGTPPHPHGGTPHPEPLPQRGPAPEARPTPLAAPAPYEGPTPQAPTPYAGPTPQAPVPDASPAHHAPAPDVTSAHHTPAPDVSSAPRTPQPKVRVRRRVKTAVVAGVSGVTVLVLAGAIVWLTPSTPTPKATHVTDVTGAPTPVSTPTPKRRPQHTRTPGPGPGAESTPSTTPTTSRLTLASLRPSGGTRNGDCWDGAVRLQAAVTRTGDPVTLRYAWIVDGTVTARSSATVAESGPRYLTSPTAVTGSGSHSVTLRITAPVARQRTVAVTVCDDTTG
ncbi:protein kinase [Nonomuraea sp. NPDC049607]|uniref:protein kinase domain-containing protein n=1 Tax=Nonomuraea sp. NPDC049607 TaxID=3154732 RepID=UPI00342F1B21